MYVDLCFRTVSVTAVWEVSEMGWLKRWDNR